MSYIYIKSPIVSILTVFVFLIYCFPTLSAVKIKGGIFGGELNFNNLNNNNLAFQVDYRSLYNHVLTTHFELPNNPFSKFKSDLITKTI